MGPSILLYQSSLYDVISYSSLHPWVHLDAHASKLPEKEMRSTKSVVKGDLDFFPRWVCRKLGMYQYNPRFILLTILLLFLGENYLSINPHSEYPTLPWPPMPGSNILLHSVLNTKRNRLKGGLRCPMPKHGLLSEW